MTDILIQQLQIFLTREIAHLRTARAFCNIERKAFRLHCLVLTSSRIEEHKLNWRYLKLTRMAGHSQNIVYHRTFYTIGSQFGLICNLSIVLIEILGELYLRLLDELQVTHTTDYDTQGNRIIRLSLSLVELCRDTEFSYTTREVGGTLRQWVNLYIDARSNNLLLHFNIAGTTIEESLERIYITILLHHDTIEGDAGNRQFARQLGEHHILAPRHRAIWATVERLHLKALLLWEIDLLRVETFQIGHLTLQLCQRNQGIYFISQEDRLLLIDALFVGTYLNEKIRS